MAPNTTFSSRWSTGIARPALFLATSFLLLAGCGHGSNLGAVEGVVTLDGNPLPGAVVSFRPVNGGKQSYGRTDANGHYELRYSAKEMGAAVCKHKVTLTTATGEGPEARFQVEKVPPQYLHSATTNLEKEVARGANKFDLDLTSK